jgi:hypothetical protein
MFRSHDHLQAEIYTSEININIKIPNFDQSTQPDSLCILFRMAGHKNSAHHLYRRPSTWVGVRRKYAKTSYMNQNERQEPLEP